MRKLPTNRGQRLQLLFLEQEKKLYRRSLTKRDLQKLLFLYLKDSGRHDYCFVPLKYGCYSFVGDKDIRSLESLGWIELGRRKVQLLEKLDSNEASFARERQEVREWLEDNSLRDRELVAASYRSDPYYAIKSVMLDGLYDLGLLELKDIREIQNAKPKDTINDSVVFTIGYEGLCVEDYMNKLIQNNVKLVCDVRRNPISRKFGFSKGKFCEILTDISIEYRHFSDLGIDSSDRKSLKSESDYNRLFAYYRENLPNKKQSIEKIEKLLESRKRIAITCFEAQPNFCHRHCISDFLKERGDKAGKYRIEHL